MALGTKVIFPAASYFGGADGTGPLGGTGTKSIWAGSIGAKVNEIQDYLGVPTITFTGASVESRVQRLEDQTELSARIFGVVPNDSTDNTAALQAAVNFVGGLGGGRVKLPPGISRSDSINCTNSRVILVGHGRHRTTLRYIGSGTGEAFLAFNGVDVGNWTQRLAGVGLEDLQLYNSGTAKSIGVVYSAVSGATEKNVTYTNWRQHARYAVDFADSDFWNNEYDFCGSSDDADQAVWHYTGLSGGEWACDALLEVGARVENIGDRSLFAGPGAGANLVNKVTLLDCKFESSSGNEMGGSAGSGCQFELINVGGFAQIGGNVVCQNMRSGHAVIPTIWDLLNCNGARIWTYVAFGAGSMPKCFNYFVTINGGQAFDIKLQMTSGNTTAYPTTVFRFVNTPVRLIRAGTSWGWSPGSPPTTDTGTVPSATTW